jgi:hypothetical protein
MSPIMRTMSATGSMVLAQPHPEFLSGVAIGFVSTVIGAALSVAFTDRDRPSGDRFLHSDRRQVYPRGVGAVLALSFASRMRRKTSLAGVDTVPDIEHVSRVAFSCEQRQGFDMVELTERAVAIDDRAESVEYSADDDADRETDREPNFLPAKLLS